MSDPARNVRVVGITRFTKTVTIRTDTVDGRQVWIVNYTTTQHGKETSYRITDPSETGARRLVANLLGNLAPGLTVADAYTDQTENNAQKK